MGRGWREAVARGDGASEATARTFACRSLSLSPRAVVLTVFDEAGLAGQPHRLVLRSRIIKLLHDPRSDIGAGDFEGQAAMGVREAVVVIAGAGGVGEGGGSGEGPGEGGLADALFLRFMIRKGPAENQRDDHVLQQRREHRPAVADAESGDGDQTGDVGGLHGADDLIGGGRAEVRFIPRRRADRADDNIVPFHGGPHGGGVGDVAGDAAEGWGDRGFVR
ncbi:MAG: hypothetical protein JWM57_3081 [Phycisphaerales bacterium]|nr:hypothetical protein [Phycisphaerales bacterium]